MKILKYVIWLILLFLTQTVVMNYIAPFGFRPDLVLPFVILIAVKEDTFKQVTLITIICAVAAGALCGKNFSLCVLFYTYTGAVVFALRKYPRYMPDLARFLIWLFPAAIIGESAGYLLLYSSFSRFVGAFMGHILPTSFITEAVGALIYFIASKTLFVKKKIIGKIITK